MKYRLVLWSCLTAFLVLANLALAQGVDPDPDDEPFLDHLKCYTITHSNQPPVGTQMVLLRNRFGNEECVVRTPARRFCVETQKTVQNGESDDPRGGEAGNFLCYDVALDAAKVPMCKSIGPVPSRLAQVEDQFGEWKIRVGSPRTLCTPTVIKCQGRACTNLPN